MKRRWLLLLAVLLFQPLYAQESEPVAEPEKDDKIKSLTEDRRDLLLYGIDNQVIELIEQLSEEENDQLAGEVYAAYKLTRNPKVRTAILEYFTEIDFREAREEAVAVVESFEDQSQELLNASVLYLTDEPFEGLADSLIPLLDATDQDTARIAIKGVGLSGDSRAAETLLELLDDREYESNLKPEIILALGDIGNPIAVPRLMEILKDEDEASIWRRYACASLGKIGDESAMPAIEDVLYDDDSHLRSYAVGSLRFFSGEKVVFLLIEALRDSFWRVRVSAAQALAELNAKEAVPILVFKAEKDPEMNVRIEAVRALGKIGDPPSLDALRGFYAKDLTPQPLRVLSAEFLAEKDLAGTIDEFKRVIDKHWGKDHSRIMEQTARILSRTESDLLEPFYARFIDSGELVIMIYGIRGIAKNGLVSMKEAIEKLAGEGKHRSIRKEALAALELLE